MLRRKIISFVFVLCVISSSFISTLGVTHEDKIETILKEYVEYDKDCSKAESDLSRNAKLRMSKINLLAPLIPALFTTINASMVFRELIRREYRRGYQFDEGVPETIVIAGSLLGGTITYGLWYVAFRILLYVPGVKESLAPQEADSLRFYKEKRKETLDYLKKYISENKISSEQLDQLRHKEYYDHIHQPEKNILWQLANEVNSCSSHG